MVKTDARDFLDTVSPRFLLIVGALLALTHFLAITFFFQKGQPILFGVLIASEIFHVWQLLGYVHTVWGASPKLRFDPDYQPPVAVFITISGEPGYIAEATLKAALKLDYPSVAIYLLNDGFVSGKKNWYEAEMLALKYNVRCITRNSPGGAKAGNINHALRLTKEPLLAILDVDHVPQRDFLSKMVGYLADSKVAFAQSPQYYQNKNKNDVTIGAWEQQSLFFGAICKGKARTNSAFMCGTNMVIRRRALDDVEGMCETNVAEDVLTSLFIHRKGWHSVYVPEILAKGLAPEDFQSYYKQQYRWARGSLEIIFKHNPLFWRGLTLSQKFQYLSSASYYLSGLAVIVNAALPLIFFFTGHVPLNIATMTLTAVFLPYIFLTFYNLQLSANHTFSFRAIAFSLAAFPIHLRALLAVLTNTGNKFTVTSKVQLTGNFIRLVLPHLAYIVLAVIGVFVAYWREGVSASLITNASWALMYIAVFMPFILAALPPSKPVVAGVVSKELAA